MQKKEVLTLAEELDFTEEFEYFDYIIESLINGQRQQVRDLYAAMKIGGQLQFLKYAAEPEGHHLSAIIDALQIEE